MNEKMLLEEFKKLNTKMEALAEIVDASKNKSHSYDNTDQELQNRINKFTTKFDKEFTNSLYPGYIKITHDKITGYIDYLQTPNFNIRIDNDGNVLEANFNKEYEIFSIRAEYSKLIPDLKIIAYQYREIGSNSIVVMLMDEEVLLTKPEIDFNNENTNHDFVIGILDLLNSTFHNIQRNYVPISGGYSDLNVTTPIYNPFPRFTNPFSPNYNNINDKITPAHEPTGGTFIDDTGKATGYTSIAYNSYGEYTNNKFTPFKNKGE